jgi:hypothetical protein
MFHLTTVVDDLAGQSEFFKRVFGVDTWGKAFFASRYARFAMVGDVVFDNMSPDHSYGSVFRTFRLLVGEHFTFPCFHVSDMQDLVYKMRTKGGRLTGILGEPITGSPSLTSKGAISLTHPWETGVEFELFEFESDAAGLESDPRLDPAWVLAPPPADSVGAEYSSHHTLVVDEPSATVDFLVGMCGGTVFREAENGALGCRSTYIALGGRFPFTVEVAVPTADGPAREDLLRNGNIYHCVTFKVGSLERAVEHLARVGVRVETRCEDLVVTDPRDCHGLRFGFTPALVPGDPRLG